jgi:cyclase
MKLRIIPTILTDGVTVVKGENFNNWRTVGNAVAIARLFSQRNVDELMVLDVNCRSNKKHVDLNLIEEFSSMLDIPFSVGGGISTLEDARSCIRAGAEKIVLGTAAVENPEIITEIANEFGSQAVVVSVDIGRNIDDFIHINSGKVVSTTIASEYISGLEQLGAGEILLQSPERDGTLSGMDVEAIQKALTLTSLPIVASSGASSLSDFEVVAKLGVSAIAAGAVFQFTQTTPNEVREYLNFCGIRVRRI